LKGFLRIKWKPSVNDGSFVLIFFPTKVALPHQGGVSFQLFVLLFPPLAFSSFNWCKIEEHRLTGVLDYHARGINCSHHPSYCLEGESTPTDVCFSSTFGICGTIPVAAAMPSHKCSKTAFELNERILFDRHNLFCPQCHPRRAGHWPTREVGSYLFSKAWAKPSWPR